MTIDLLGFGNTDNAVTVRPARSITRGASDTWAKDCSSPDSADGTSSSADVFNDILAQLRTVIRSAGVTQDNADDMLWRAMQSVGVHIGIDTGAASAIVATCSPPITALNFGTLAVIKADADPSGATTFAPDAMATKSVKWGDGTAIAVGDYKAGALLIMGYDGTQWQLLSTINRTVSGAGGGFVPGCIYDWSTETVPDGTFECNGAAISRTTYARLFGIVGTRYGQGNGTTTFNLPDFRGRFRRSWDHGIGRDTDAATRVASAAGGAVGDHVGSVEASAAGPVNLASATAEIDSFELETPGASGVGPAGWYGADLVGVDLSAAAFPTAYVPSVSARHGAVGNIPSIRGSLAVTGNSDAAETRPANVNVLTVIAY